MISDDGLSAFVQSQLPYSIYFSPLTSVHGLNNLPDQYYSTTKLIFPTITHPKTHLCAIAFIYVHVLDQVLAAEAIPSSKPLTMDLLYISVINLYIFKVNNYLLGKGL